MLSRFHLIPACDGQTVGQTNRIAISKLSISRVSVLTHDKNLISHKDGNKVYGNDPHSHGSVIPMDNNRLTNWS